MKPLKNSTFIFSISPLLVSLVMGNQTAFAQTEIELSGQVSRAVMIAKDGNRSKTFFADNGNSNSRIRLRGSRDIDKDLTAGLRFEFAYPSNPSADISMDESSISAEWQERHVDLFIKGSFGVLSLGQGSGAANGAMEEDLSGTDIASNSDLAGIGGGLEFQRENLRSGPSINDTLNNLDFEGRYDRIRYDLPRLGKISVSVSAGDKNDNEVYELAARSGFKWHDGRMRIALGYSTESRGGNRGSEQTVGGSISYLLPNGYNATLAIGSRGRESADSLDANYVYLKFGYLAGRHAFSIDYGASTDLDEADDKSVAYGAAYVYSPKKWIDLFVGVKQHSLDRGDTGFRDISIRSAGMRLKF